MEVELGHGIGPWMGRPSSLPRSRRGPYLDPVTRFRHTVRRHGVAALVVATALAGAVGTVNRTDPSMPTGPAAWVEAAAIAGLVLVLLLRGRYPFGAPAFVWLASAALSFVDGELITSQGV